ncbi:MAG: nucleotidyl transferase AbiEii/AbiGii toxin family protein [Candidatus Saganbacteria bacterium]|nr:nucleotidyl transferase AbiEii/AbiGii toxin family protein [Candidatus Saganbacteria bacterium]
MLEFDKIKEYFDPVLVNRNPKGILVEYLQYEFLDSLFKLPGAEKLSFIGGTAIRIVHDSCRFSEDLDFDNFGLRFKSFKELIAKACSEMQLKGFKLETRFLEKKNNYHCYVKFPGILFQLGVSGHRDEKIFLSVDAEKKRKIFSSDIQAINKFGIFRNIKVNPAPILLSQKLLAVLYRKREKGRDFYDVSFLSGKTRIDYGYIRKMTGLDQEAFGQKIIARCKKLNYKVLAADVEPFLFNADQKQRVLNFKETLFAIL